MPFLYSSWPGLTRPPIALASASAKDSLRRADARRIGGRLKAGHDDWGERPLHFRRKFRLYGRRMPGRLRLTLSNAWGLVAHSLSGRLFLLTLLFVTITEALDRKSTRLN